MHPSVSFIRGKNKKKNNPTMSREDEVPEQPLVATAEAPTMSPSLTPSSASSYHSAVSDLAVLHAAAADDDDDNDADNNDDGNAPDTNGSSDVSMDEDAHLLLSVDDDDDDADDDQNDKSGAELFDGLESISNDADHDDPALELDDEVDSDADADVSMDDSEVDLTLLQEELAAATLDHDRAAEMAVAAAAVATPTKPKNGQAQEGKAAGKEADQKKKKDKKEEVSPAKSLATQGTMDVSASEESDYGYGEDDDDTFHENGYGYTDVEVGLGGGKKKISKNKSSKMKKKTTRNNGGGCCESCPTRCKVLGFFAFLAVMAGAIAYLFLGGDDGGPIWTSSSASAANQASNARDGSGSSEGTLGVISTYEDEDEEKEDDETDKELTSDLEDSNPNAPPGCTNDDTWRLMRRDITGTNPGGFVLSSDGCDFIAQHPSRHCGKSGLAVVESSKSAGGIATQVTMTASEACPVSCGTCEEYLEAKEAAAIAVETASPTASPTLGPTATPTAIVTTDPTSTPTVPIVMEVERESDEFFYDWDAVIAGATYDCPDPETVLGEDLFDSREEAGKVDTRLGEASGLASSRIHPGILYTHEDYKDLNEFYAIDAENGEILGDFVLVGATNRDYEDMSVGPGPDEGASYVYVGDVGDNWEKRLDIKIYRVKESLLQIGAGVRQEITDFDTLTLTYHDGAAHNSEAFYFDPVDQLIYIVRKEGGKMWRTPTKWGPGDATMTLVRDIDIGSNPNQIISGADMSPDGREVLLKYYGAVRYYCRKPGQSMMMFFLPPSR